jgi:hypothetical protein
MIKRLFEAVEGVCQAVTYLLTLFMGAVIVTLAAYTILFLAIRIAQLLWTVLFATKWV